MDVFAQVPVSRDAAGKHGLVFHVAVIYAVAMAGRVSVVPRLLGCHLCIHANASTACDRSHDVYASCSTPAASRHDCQILWRWHSRAALTSVSIRQDLRHYQHGIGQAKFATAELVQRSDSH